MPKAKGLTPKQQMFVREYLIDLDATKASIRAGYSEKTAGVIGYQLLQKTLVRDAIDKAKIKRAQRVDITADSVLQEIAKLGFANMMDYIEVGEDGAYRVDFKKLDRDKAAAIQEVTVEEYTERTGTDENGKPTFESVKRVKFKLSDKGQNLERLGRHLKLFTDRLEVKDASDFAERTDEEIAFFNEHGCWPDQLTDGT